MGKIRKNKQKYAECIVNEQNSNSMKNNPMLLEQPNDNIFSGANISFDNLSKKLSDDTASVFSLKSTKSDLGSRISKKEKVKLKHEILLRKIDTANKFKKKQKQRSKRKKNVIIGDTNPLHDALPSLDSLLKSRDIKIKVRSETNKKKGTATSKSRQKNVVQGVNMFKMFLSNKQFQKDPLRIINEHIKQRVNSGDL